MVEPNAAAVERLWSPDYIQHSPLQPAGRQPILDWVGAMEKNGTGDFRYELVRAIADGDLVALHGKVTGFAPQPSVLVNVFRVEGGRLAEHWEGIQAIVPKTASGRSMLEGPTEVTDLHLTEANKAMVKGFMEQVIVAGDLEAMPGFFDGNTYDQHNPMFADGVSTFRAGLAAMTEKGMGIKDLVIHRYVGMGNFVLAHSGGEFAGKPYQFFDLFRLEGGKIVEHWDCMQDLSAGSKNSNGVF